MDEPQVMATATVANFAPGTAPALRVPAGQPFTVHTRDRFASMPGGGERPSREAITALTGPVSIDGIKAGDVLAVSVLSIASSTGSAYLLGSPAYGVLGDQIEPRVNVIPVTERTVQLAPDLSLPYKPMIGKLGVATDAASDGAAFGDHGGALSTTELGPGATLLLAVHEDGGGVRLDDVHALMGDGESTASGVEMAARVRLKCERFSGDATGLPLPLLLTTKEVVVFGSGASLDAATDEATSRMLELLMVRRGIDRTEAALLFGAAADVRVSFVGSKPSIARVAFAREALRL